tara:strand:- start:23 stop:358 length:336 start_codon:yes stop_codon:yes gene_type:complete
MEKYTQKLFIDKMIKSKEITIVEISEVLGTNPSALRMTLLRNNLFFKQFCTIYKYVYGVDFRISDNLTHVNRNLIHDITLSSAVEIMEKNKTPIIVTLYKKTKIRLINETK